MFSSQTFLARKGRLGTVWFAAHHMQHRLKKSHYTSTDIPSTVERILYPDIPIALRMSGHLLLGVVDLPDNENQAPVHAITLPETFNLDALELDDDDIYTEGSPDSHLRYEEDIRLPDQIPTGANPCIAITFDEVSQFFSIC
ncbi:hypothetical protein SLEP1_g45202 [Rubroshorea leprosula]|uniref:Rad21/Rec8-like protein N-terminal domain-containing protein n=1 Tax=Rubroshorea leprosula TaxID=152421 RepID=A0AAV5LJ21_9ROSI|nr:hypothetical protein SLEP1_g45202 [Rubroshorea leprosula]